MRTTATISIGNRLAEARSDDTIDHLIVFLHNPVYSTTMDASIGYTTIEVRDAYEELFRRYRVDMVLSGHAHLYDRFVVPEDGSETRSTPRPPAHYQKSADNHAIHYLVTGGGGGGNINECKPEMDPSSMRYAQRRKCRRHFTSVRVDGPRLLVKIVELWTEAWPYVDDSYRSYVVEDFVIEP